MIEVTLNCEEVVGDSFVKIGCVAGAIARARGTGNLAQAERKLFWRVNSGVQLGLLNPLDPETLEPLSREDYGMGVVPFHELVEWGHATNLFKFKSEFISPEAVPWARAAPSMRDMVAAVQAKAAPVIRQELEAVAVVMPEPSAAPTLAASPSGGVKLDKAGPAKPLQRTAAQDSAILCEIEKQGYDPLALPKNLPGKPGVKADIRAALSQNSLFTGRTVFDKAWERLTARADIAIQG